VSDFKSDSDREAKRWYKNGMRATIDKAGRVVIPRALRDRVGITPGEVEITADGAGVRIEPLAGEGLVEVGGRLVIPASGVAVDDALVRELRDGDQR
jgi:AbrB family looped-hinge helix DNA binding protein